MTWQDDRVWKSTAVRIRDSGRGLTTVDAQQKLLLSSQHIQDISKRVMVEKIRRYYVYYSLYDPLLLLECAFRKYGGARGLNHARHSAQQESLEDEERGEERASQSMVMSHASNKYSTSELRKRSVLSTSNSYSNNTASKSKPFGCDNEQFWTVYCNESTGMESNQSRAMAMILKL